MTKLMLPVAAPVLLLNLGVAPSQVQSFAFDTPRITVDCEHCSDETRAKVKNIAAGVMRAEDSACFRKYFADHPPTEVEIRVAVRGADICGKDGVTVTPKTTDQMIQEVTTAGRDLTIHFRNTGLACAWEGDSNSGLFQVRTGKFTHTCWASFDDAEKGGVIVHEFTHKLGYKHCTNSANTEDNTTVPYTVKRAVETCWLGRDGQQ